MNLYIVVFLGIKFIFEVKKGRVKKQNFFSHVLFLLLVIPPRTTGVGRGFPTFRAGSSIIYRSSMNLVPLSAERRTTSMSTIDRCRGIAATDRNFCLFRDTRSLTDSGSY